jgi:hypothetical protein
MNQMYRSGPAKKTGCGRAKVPPPNRKPHINCKGGRRVDIGPDGGHLLMMPLQQDCMS